MLAHLVDTKFSEKVFHLLADRHSASKLYDVLHAITWFRYKYGWRRVSRSAIAKFCNCSLKTVSRANKTLEEAGIFIIDRKFKVINGYETEEVNGAVVLAYFFRILKSTVPLFLKFIKFKTQSIYTESKSSLKVSNFNSNKEKNQEEVSFSRKGDAFSTPVLRPSGTGDSTQSTTFGGTPLTSTAYQRVTSAGEGGRKEKKNLPHLGGHPLQETLYINQSDNFNKVNVNLLFKDTLSQEVFPDNYNEVNVHLLFSKPRKTMAQIRQEKFEAECKRVNEMYERKCRETMLEIREKIRIDKERKEALRIKEGRPPEEFIPDLTELFARVKALRAENKELTIDQAKGIAIEAMKAAQ